MSDHPFEKLNLNYQIERFSLEDGPVTGQLQAVVTYTGARDVAPGIVEFHTLCFNPDQEEIRILIADLLKRLCGLVDAVKEAHARSR